MNQPQKTEPRHAHSARNLGVLQTTRGSGGCGLQVFHLEPKWKDFQVATNYPKKKGDVFHDPQITLW